MEDREKPSWAIRIFGPLIFILGSLAALSWFFYRAYFIFSRALSEVVVFDKGSFYMLGVGVGMLALAMVAVLEGWLGQTLSKKQSVFLTRLAVAGVILIFTVPHFVQYVADDFLQGRGYSVCEEASHQWLFVRDIVYIQESITCSENLAKKQ